VWTRDRLVSNRRWRCGGVAATAVMLGGAGFAFGVRARGCPACHWRRLREGSLEARHPELAAEWHPTRNAGLDVCTIGHSSQRQVWWRCGRCGHEWRTTVKHRTYRGQGCPECGKRRSAELATSAGRWRVPRERSFAVLHSELLPEWDPVRNEGLDPFAVGIGSNLRIWWRCTVCGFEWRSRPAHRIEGRGCRRCRQASSRIGTRWARVVIDGLRM
jgi:DNA-directed RNA polymerase subunit RPC12/RpoP